MSERLIGALVDPKGCNRAVLLLLIAYAATWTLYGSISHSSEDLHPDMTELVSWSRDLSLGYLKHPPLAAWLVRLWFTVFPLADWSYYLLAMLMPTIALWIFWRLSADYLQIDHRVIGVALLILIPFYNFHALKFNANTVLVPTWAATTFWFLRSYKTRRVFYGILTGLGAGACMLGKYWSVFLLVGLFVAALADSRRRIYFRSIAPWCAVVVGFAVLAPHLVWLFQHDFAPLEYATAKHTARTFASVVAQVFSYLAGCAAYVAVPVILTILAARPNRATMAEMLWPRERERRLVAFTFWGPLLLPVAGGLAGGIDLAALWSMPGWTLLPILLLSPPQVKLSWANLRGIVAVAVAEPIAMLLAAPAIAIAIHWAGVRPPMADSRLLAAETERAWHEATPKPLRHVGCDLADEVITYASDRPHAMPARLFRGDIADQVYADERGWAQTAVRQSTVSDEELIKDGMVLVCSAAALDWLQAAEARAGRDPASRRIETEITRSFLGIEGRSHRYFIFVIPPHS